MAEGTDDLRRNRRILWICTGGQAVVAPQGLGKLALRNQGFDGSSGGSFGEPGFAGQLTHGEDARGVPLDEVKDRRLFQASHRITPLDGQRSITCLPHRVQKRKG